MKYEEPVPADKIYHGCMCCGGTTAVASMDNLVFSDDGTITKNGEQVWPPKGGEVTAEDWARIIEDKHPDPVTRKLSEFEEMAKLEPDADWRFSFVKALRDGVYQRQGEGKWVLIESGKGYA